VNGQTGTMLNEERLYKTIRFEKTDKILSGPGIAQFAATYTGITQKDFLDPDKAEAAFERTFNELGGWDLLGMAPSPNMPELFMRELLPGRDLPDNAIHQILEEEVMLPADYDYVIQNGFNALAKQLSQRINAPQPPPEERERLATEAVRRAKANKDKWTARGVAFATSIGAMHPINIFSLSRSISKFSLDIHRMPDKVAAAVKACLPDMIADAKKEIETTGCRRSGMPIDRGSPVFINAKQFEKLVLPAWLEYVYALTDAGMDLVFHCDTNWTRFLPYFKEFPRKRCLLQLDGATDIFKAKEILQDHMAIMGDVPATLLSMGTPEEVTNYCQKIIKGIGEGGGFVLSSGCSVPHDAKVENVRAMVKAGNELTWY
jgi:uroporphyrinogen-III decarboxylase